jgi:predicted metal-dependent hydrolase
MDFSLFFPHRAKNQEQVLSIGDQTVTLQLVRNPRARRYILRLLPGGTARVTIPRGGSAAEATRFAHRHTEWLQKQLVRLAQPGAERKSWKAGDLIYYRGTPVALETHATDAVSHIHFGDQSVSVPDTEADLRPHIERHLRKLASSELPARARELASEHGFVFSKVTVRNQRTRWGSCSVRGSISLNWRLVQTPESVRDYIILHELAHLRQMNHSTRFWREVARICPEYQTAELWLKRNSKILR